jgi:hypothetical protein
MFMRIPIGAGFGMTIQYIMTLVMVGVWGWLIHMREPLRGLGQPDERGQAVGLCQHISHDGGCVQGHTPAGDTKI